MRRAIGRFYISWLGQGVFYVGYLVVLIFLVVVERLGLRGGGFGQGIVGSVFFLGFTSCILWTSWLRWRFTTSRCCVWSILSSRRVSLRGGRRGLVVWQSSRRVIGVWWGCERQLGGLCLVKVLLLDFWIRVIGILESKIFVGRVQFDLFILVFSIRNSVQVKEVDVE